MCCHDDINDTHDTTRIDAFPDKIHFEDGSYVIVKDVLLENVPFYLRRIAEEGIDHEDEQDAKFQYENIQSVDVVCINTDNVPWHASEDGIDCIWGAGLKVNLRTNQYFLIYIPFDMNYIERDVEDFAEEAYNGIEVVPADTDLEYQLHKMPYARSSNVVYINSTNENTLTLLFL